MLKSKYQNDLESLKNVYRLKKQDKESQDIVTSVKDQIFGEYDLNMANDLDMQAQYEVDAENSLFLQVI